MPNQLPALETQIKKELAMLDFPLRDWVQSKKTTNGSQIYNVLIIGAGQSGLGVAFGLMREKVPHILVVDKNPEGLEGPWKTFARMKTLRTPKHVLGPDWNIPSLGVQSWYEAQYGEGSWDQLVFLKKELWADYLYWYRKTLKIPVINDAEAGAIAWDESNQCFQVPITQNQQTQIYHTRKVVLATGINGSGRWHVPNFISENLPENRYNHTRSAIDFDALVGKRVAVLGAGASAFDNASVALEMGAKSIDLFFRRPK